MICWQRGLLWMLCFILGASLFYGIQSSPLRDYRETVYAETGREMLANPSTLIPHLNGSPFLDKPPLVSWLVSLFFKVFGIGQGVARLSSVMAILWSALVVGWMTRRIFGPGQGILAALLFLGTPGMQYYGRMLMSDTVFMAWTVTAIAAFAEGYLREHRGWYRLGFVICAFATLTRGPIGLIYPLGSLIAFFVLVDRQAWKSVPWITGSLLFLLIAGPWFAMIAIRYPGFLDLFFIQHHFNRFNPAVSHPFIALPRWQILLGFAGFLGPMVFLLPWTITTVRGKQSAQHLLWLLVLLVMASVLLANGRNHPYTLPALPPLVALIAGRLGGLSEQTPPAWSHFSAILIGLFGLTIVAALPWLPQILGRVSVLLANAPTFMTVQLCLTLVAVFILSGSLFLWRGKGLEACAALAMLMIPGAFMLTHVQQQLAPLESRASLAQIVAREVPSTWPVVIANPQDYLFEGVGGWGFYARRQVFMVAFQNRMNGPFWGLMRPEWILNQQDFVDMWTSSRPLVLVATSQALAQLPFGPLPPPHAHDEKFGLWILPRDRLTQAR